VKDAAILAAALADPTSLRLGTDWTALIAMARAGIVRMSDVSASKPRSPSAT